MYTANGEGPLIVGESVLCISEQLSDIVWHQPEKSQNKSIYIHVKKSFLQMLQASNHGADGVETGVKADDFPLGSFCVGVVHGILKCSLSVVVLVHRTSCVLRFVRFPAD